MPDPKSTTSPPKPGTESGDPEVAALHDAVTAIKTRLDGMKRDDDKRDDKRKADDRRDDSPVDMSEIASMLRVILRHLDGDGDEPEAESDDDRRDDRQRPDDKDLPPRRLAADDRRDRKDAADDDDTKTLTAQGRADSALSLHGRRVDRPRVGESSHSYRRRVLKQLVAYSPKHRGMDPHLIGDDRALAELENNVIEAVTANAYDPTYNIPQSGLREVHETDRTGRKIIKFVGDVGMTLAPFRSPPHRARINRPPGSVYNNA